MNRVVINMDEQGGFTVTSDEPIEFFVVCDHIKSDRVYQMDVDVGVEKVRAELRDDMVGHKMDDRQFGQGYGPAKPPSKPTLKLVD
ncbi:hypothetical protein V6767_20180 [Martelella sp. FLE1502]